MSYAQLVLKIAAASENAGTATDDAVAAFNTKMANWWTSQQNNQLTQAAAQINNTMVAAIGQAQATAVGTQGGALTLAAGTIGSASVAAVDAVTNARKTYESQSAANDDYGFRQSSNVSPEIHEK